MMRCAFVATTEGNTKPRQHDKPEEVSTCLTAYSINKVHCPNSPDRGLGSEKHIKKKHANIIFTGLSRDFGGDFVSVFSPL